VCTTCRFVSRGGCAAWPRLGLRRPGSPATTRSQAREDATPEELSWFAARAGFADVRTRSGTLWITAIARKPDGPATPAGG
jgi:hypothetical protein